MVDIKSIDKTSKTVHFDDNTSLTHEHFLNRFTEFFKNRIAGETLMPGDMERFMARTSAKNLKLLMKGKKMEGYLEGSIDKFLSSGQKIAIATIATLAMIGIIAFVVLRNQGVF